MVPRTKGNGYRNGSRTSIWWARDCTSRVKGISRFASQNRRAKFSPFNVTTAGIVYQILFHHMPPPIVACVCVLDDQTPKNIPDSLAKAVAAAAATTTITIPLHFVTFIFGWLGGLESFPLCSLARFAQNVIALEMGNHVGRERGWVGS